jgi:hypothetical protein
LTTIQELTSREKYWRTRKANRLAAAEERYQKETAGWNAAIANPHACTREQDA